MRVRGQAVAGWAFIAPVLMLVSVWQGLGYASARALVLLSVILAMTLLQVRLLEKEVAQLAG